MKSKSVKFVSAKELKDQKAKNVNENDVATMMEKLSRIEKILVEVLERLEALEEAVKRSESLQREGGIKEKNRKVVVRSSKEKRSALDIVKEQGIVFESDLRNIVNRDRFFSHLSKHDIIVISGIRERVAVTKEFLDSFMKELEKYSNPSEAEEKLKEAYARLYRVLRESGLLLYDSKKGWLLSIEKTS